MAPLEELSFEPRGDVLLARVKGEVDLSNVWSVKEQLLHAVPNTATALVLDLSDTAHLDSSGIRLIFELAERLRSHGQKLRLVVPDDSVISRVLMITEVHQVVPISASVEAVLGDEVDDGSS
jgi:anti-sigma B factor antagonist